MTREMALKVMQQGGKVTHVIFSKEEYLHMVGYKIYTEDGYVFTSEFYSRTAFNDGWSIRNDT